MNSITACIRAKRTDPQPMKPGSVQPKWYSNAETIPQAINLAKNPLIISLTSANDSGFAKEHSNVHNRKAMATNRMTPLILCKIEVIAGRGNRNCVRSRLTGLFLFTVLSHSAEALLGRVNWKCLEKNQPQAVHLSTLKQFTGAQLPYNLFQNWLFAVSRNDTNTYELSFQIKLEHLLDLYNQIGKNRCRKHFSQTTPKMCEVAGDSGYEIIGSGNKNYKLLTH